MAYAKQGDCIQTVLLISELANIFKSLCNDVSFPNDCYFCGSLLFRPA